MEHLPETDPVAAKARGGRRLPNWLVAVGLGVLVYALLMSTGLMYGVTYDEPIYSSAWLRGQAWFNVMARNPAAALGADGIRDYWQSNCEHPGFAKLTSAIASFTLGRLTLANAAFRTGTLLLVSILGAALYLFVTPLWGRAAGLYAVGALLLMPRVFHDSHLGTLDAPVMAMTFLTLAAGFRACRGEGSRWGWILAAGALWGLALGTKLNAFFVPLVLLPWAFLFARRRALALAGSLLVMGALFFVLSWPWLWYETGPRLLQYLRFHLEHRPVPVSYFGRVYQVAPWHYPLVMTLITLPPMTLLLALLGAARLRAWRRDASLAGVARERTAALVLVSWGVVVNLALHSLPQTLKYDGVRLFLPIFPLIAVLAAAGFRAGLDWLLRWPRARALTAGAGEKVALVGLIAALLGPLTATAKFLPHHHSYFNFLIGGLPGAARAGMDPTYWGDTFRPAIRWLLQNAAPGSRVWIEPAWFEVGVRQYEVSPLTESVTTCCGPDAFATADYAVVQNKPSEWTEISRRLIATARPVYTFELEGVPLVFVFQRGVSW